MAGALAGWEEGGEDPKICTSRIEVQVQCLATNSDRNQVLNTVGWRGWCGAILALLKLAEEASGELLGWNQVVLGICFHLFRNSRLA